MYKTIQLTGLAARADNFSPIRKSDWLHRLTSKVAVIVKMSESDANTDLLPARYIWPDVMRRGLLPPSSC